MLVARSSGASRQKRSLLGLRLSSSSMPKELASMNLTDELAHFGTRINARFWGFNRITCRSVFRGRSFCLVLRIGSTRRLATFLKIVMSVISQKSQLATSSKVNGCLVPPVATCPCGVHRICIDYGPRGAHIVRQGPCWNRMSSLSSLPDRPSDQASWPVVPPTPSRAFLEPFSGLSRACSLRRKVLKPTPRATWLDFHTHPMLHFDLPFHITAKKSILFDKRQNSRQKIENRNARINR